MKGLESLIRVHKWKLDEKRRELGDFEKLRGGFLNQLNDLKMDLHREQEIATQHADVSFSFVSYARAMREQQDNLVASIEELDGKIEVLTDEVAVCFQELKKYEIAVDIRGTRQKYERQRTEQIELDDIAIDMHRRKSHHI